MLKYYTLSQLMRAWDSPESGVLPQDHKARMAAMLPSDDSADLIQNNAAHRQSYLRTHSTTSAVDYKYFDVGIGQVINRDARPSLSVVGFVVPD